MNKLASLLLVICCHAGFAQIQFEGLQQCLDYSKHNNLLLKIENLNREISNEKLRSARASLLPQVKAFGNLDDNLSLPVQLVPAQILGGNEGEYAKLKFGTQFAASYGAEASLSLINISNWKNVKSATLAEEASAFQAKDKELSTTEQIVTAYYYTLLTRELITLNQELVTSSDSLLDAAEVRLSNSLIEQLDYNRVKTIYLESLQMLRESQGAYEKNLNILKSLCGLAGKDSLILTESITQSMLRNFTLSSLQTTVEFMPRHRMLSVKTFQAEEELKRQRSKTLPELSLYVRYSRQAFRDEFTFFSATDAWFDVAVTGLRAEWNIFTGLNRQSSIRQATLQHQIAQNELENYSIQTEKELNELRINHQVTADGVSRFMEHYHLTLSNYYIAGEKYKQGVYSIDQYITIYQELVRSQNQYLNKLASYLIYDAIVSTRNSLK